FMIIDQSIRPFDNNYIMCKAKKIKLASLQFELTSAQSNEMMIGFNASDNLQIKYPILNQCDRKQVMILLDAHTNLVSVLCGVCADYFAPLRASFLQLLYL